MKTIQVKIKFIEPILGTAPANPDIYRDFIGSKAPDAMSAEDEVAALGVDEVAEKGMTVSPGARMASRSFGTTRSRVSSRARARR